MGLFKYTLVASDDGSKHTFLEGFEFKDGPVHLEETAGYIEAHPYIEGQGSLQRRHFAVNVGHIDLIGSTTVTSEGFSAGTETVSVFGSLFQSKFSGQAVGVNLREGFLAATVSQTFSKSGQHNNVTLTERINRRFDVSQFIEDGRSVNFGGDIRGNLISGGATYNMLYTSAGFQKALNVNARVQLRRLTVNVALTILPSGVYYTGYAGCYLQGATLAGESLSHMAE